MCAALHLSPPEVLGGDDREHRAPEAERSRVSVIIPAYLSYPTVAGCLEALRRQEYRSFEVVVVDSSPDERTADVVRRFPEVWLVRSRRRLLPHAARNEGVTRARGKLLVFIDPDVYARPDWLRELVAAHDATGQPVVGSLACHGGRWLDAGIHLCKFSKWLPGGDARPVDMAPTANLLVDRATFDGAGGFDGDYMLADVILSWRLLGAGKTLWFAPRAQVAHHHLSTLRGFLRERVGRGVLFGELRSGWGGHDRRQSLLYLLVSLLPLRLARILRLVAAHAHGAGWSRQLVATLPVVLLGHAASLLGESRAYLARLAGATPAAPARRGTGPGAVGGLADPVPASPLDELPLGR
jgi:glycosyltransferase involved in cell wall biosynthesis